jgi:tetratricopeptide (TPR) repeat protein
MNIADCYRLLGLRTGASHEDIKAAYRRLARQLHPDVNPGDQRAKERFINVTEAYRFLLTLVEPAPVEPASTSPQPPEAPVQPTTQPKVTVKKAESAQVAAANLSLEDRQLKLASYEQLQRLFQKKNFPRAIALVEGLAQRLPDDPEVRQWQAITYQRWGRQLIQYGQPDKARLYLKKALRTDPHNRSLWSEVERDFRRLEQSSHPYR